MCPLHPSGTCRRRREVSASIVRRYPSHHYEVQRNARITAQYARVREEIEAAGGQWAVAKGLDDALATLEHWGAIKPDLSMKP